MAEKNSGTTKDQSKLEEVVMEGTIIFRQIDITSKSNRARPFLCRNKDRIIPLFVKGDNPFENKTLQKYDGKQVEITGGFRNNVFEISKIKEVL